MTNQQIATVLRLMNYASPSKFVFASYNPAKGGFYWICQNRDGSVAKSGFKSAEQANAARRKIWASA